ncbi:LysR family transcriptional regulator [Pseudodesulfovibrio tunisiensis]|uniref:LysR family transcriptional regulator n=1 Tax=Pseudodesulfovibrio tunisiensis TaxID=463192 RepID=UPI001FB2ECA2|nr:LysR family transcriptional regulator [Pseudodesulfovibrio tunisiensis]
MELYQLKTFIVVAEEAHLTRASERLHASQPTVSAHIKSLEEELATRLFIRTPKGMRLTEAGTLLKARADAVLAAVADMRREARLLNDELVGEVSVGLSTDADFLRVVPLVTGLGEAHPRITLQLGQGYSTSIRDDVRSGNLDAGFVFGEPRQSDIHAVRLESTQFYVAVPDVWKDSIKGGLDALARLPWINSPSDCPAQSLFNKFFADNNIQPAITLEADGDEIIRALVAAGKGISFFRAEEAEAASRIGRPVHCVPFDGLTIDLFFIFQRNRDQDPVMSAVLNQVQKVWSMD